jgi:hypothetical protein
MDISSQTLKEILESFKSQLDDRLDAFAHGLINSLTHSLTYGVSDSFHSIQDSLNDMQERFLMQGLMNEYNQERYVWYDFEDDCDDWYMDSCHFWDDNHFHIIQVLNIELHAGEASGHFGGDTTTHKFLRASYY